jgi:hypothetical protein
MAPAAPISTGTGTIRIDMLIHISVHDLQRNLGIYSISKNGPLDRFAPGWRNCVNLNPNQQHAPLTSPIGQQKWRNSASLRLAMNWFGDQRKINDFTG